MLFSIYFTSLAKLSGFFVFPLLLFISITAFSNDEVEKTKPDLMLLKSFDSNIDVNGWVMSEKLDGVRAYWNGMHLISRQGNVFNAPAWFTEGFPKFELDGELWLGRNQFESTVSIVNKKTPDQRWKKITYHVFEVPNQAGGLLDRLGILTKFLRLQNNTFLRVIDQRKITSNKMLDIELHRVLALGGEGLVVRDPKTTYQTGRLTSALKVKLKQDAECIVSGYINGKGKYQGMVGALRCDLIPAQVDRLFPKLKQDKDVTIKIGSGLTDEQRKIPPKMGAMITFQYIGLTKNGLPRFPVFLRERIDSHALKTKQAW